jgi:hypothetical protein
MHRFWKKYFAIQTVINDGGIFEMKKLLSGLVLAMIPLVLFGCGSGDFSNSSGTTISGVASKGPISGGKVAIFSVTTSAHIGKQLATGTTTASGAFSADLGAYTGAIFATMSGSSASYTDETTNTTKTLGATSLHAAAVITAPGPFNLAVTPLTELAYQRAASLKPADITTANTSISNQFLAGTSIISTLPANILSTAPAVTDPDKIKYSLALAAFSQLISSSTISAGVTQLSAAITSNTLASVWSPAVSSLATNANIQAGLVTAPVSITFSSPTYSAIISQPVTITANVTKFDGTAVPAGTKVTFTASAGALGTPTTTDASGNATVVLTPSALGTVTVNASATASGVTVSTKTAAVVTVVKDPNDIGSVTLTPATSSVQAGQTVTLTAKAGVVGGGPTNIPPNNPPPVGTVVTFTITSGSGTLGTPTTTDANGNATVTVTSGTAGTVTVTATGETITSSPATITFTPNPLAPATVTVSASPSTGVNTTSTITATVTNYLGAPLSGVPVAFTTTGGTLSAASATTAATTGTATVTLTNPTAGTVTVTASATAVGVTKAGTTTVTFITPPPRPTTATVKVATSGTLPAGTTIGSIQADVTYATTKGLTPTAAVASGAGAGSTFIPNLTTAPGDVTLGLINATGISTGEFATVTFTIAAGTPVPVATDFAVAPGFAITSATGATLSNISVTILSVTFQ